MGGRFGTGRNGVGLIVSPPDLNARWSLDLPKTHKVPVSWFKTYASAPIRWRLSTEILPDGAATEVEIGDLRAELLSYRKITQAVKKQQHNGLWARNILGIAPAKTQGITDVGTVARYRQLLELGVPSHERCFRLANRTLFRILSRDPDPALLFEFRKFAKTYPEIGPWARGLMREASTAALARAGLWEDPRVRGAAHRIVTDNSHFLRSELAANPFVKKGSRWVLHPAASPPTIFSVAILAFLPRFQRERAGFVDRLASYLAKPAPRRTYVLQFGRKVVQPTFYVLGEPLKADSTGHPKDLPFALHWIELLVRLGQLESSPAANRILGRLLKDCNEHGVWSPKGLRTFAKSPSKLADFAYPLEIDAKNAERRRADVTFRLSLIAKLAGWELEYT